MGKCFLLSQSRGDMHVFVGHLQIPPTNNCTLTQIFLENVLNDLGNVRKFYCKRGTLSKTALNFGTMEIMNHELV